MDKGKFGCDIPPERRKYQAMRGSDNRPAVIGPGNGLGYHSGTLWPGLRFDNDEDAERAAEIADIAFEQGMFYAQAQMREALGLGRKT